MTWENINWDEIWQATQDTLTMMVFSMIFTVILGLALGVLLYLTSSRQLLHMPVLYSVLSFVVNILRSVPFIILMIAVMPLTEAIVTTTIGVKGAIPPLVIGAAPFFARLVETALREVDKGVIEAAQSMGASKWDIVRRVLLRESRPGLLAAITVTAVTLVSYTAMMGTIGAGGLGDLAIRYGYMRFQTDIMIVTVVILIVLVQLLQVLGDWLVRRISRR
ncbi:MULTISPECIES: methionine ABC transporter permease [unclassified Paenibacillus]|uniref:methionine ABC transporter permease n=1 Tax=unclassified Paenibacillus TaxID=185978 RepID=UPI000956976C|nr:MULTISPECIES: methionine ABC transporter permease [unclassified Paenibacillus]ASS66108.1 ABC transporter permease [Paenibacillus sp. RUD330]SIQ12337.1 D-methionine transport system permease protein [Paenibacillus sp. RU4X]SIQ34021.1 D-methionine transport system permease protein [Paenibacillus sp. RU4T]